MLLVLVEGNLEPPPEPPNHQLGKSTPPVSPGQSATLPGCPADGGSLHRGPKSTHAEAEKDVVEAL